MRMYPPLFRYRGHYRHVWARRGVWVRVVVVGLMLGAALASAVPWR